MAAPLELRYPGRPRSIRFVRKVNRFLVEVVDDRGDHLEAHLANPGRLQELLGPGRRGHVVAAPPGSVRRTRWTLTSIEAPPPGRGWVCVDAGGPARWVGTVLSEDRWRVGGRRRPWRAEVPWKDCRFDFGWRGRDGALRGLLEVKSSNLREGEDALFPDAPTVRGRHHVERLAQFHRAGGEATLLFLVQRDDVAQVRAYGAMDPPFARAVESARRAGVRLEGRTLRVFPGGVRWGRRVPVGAPRWEAGEDLVTTVGPAS